LEYFGMPGAMPTSTTFMLVASVAAHAGHSRVGVDSVLSEPQRASAGQTITSVECQAFAGRQIVTHHKCGTAMTVLATGNMSHHLQGLCPGDANDTTTLSTDHVGAFVEGHNDTWIGTAQYVLQVARNPFEMVVSELNYDLADSETFWMNISMDCAYVPSSGAVDARAPPEKPLDGYPRFCLALRSVAAAASASGALYGVLPEVSPANQSWIDYLSGLSQDHALLAITLSLKVISLEPMRLTREALVNRTDVEYGMVCEPDFEGTLEACEDLWAKVLRQPLGMTGELPSLLARGAAPISCPAAAPTVSNHSSYDETKTEAEGTIARLRALDETHLGGYLQRLEAAMPCPLGDRYA